MKKIIALFMLSFCLTHASQAQLDSNRAGNDTNTLGQNKVYNNKRNQDSMNNKMNKDSINDKKKMPPKKNNGTSINYEFRIMNYELMEFNNKQAFLIFNS